MDANTDPTAFTDDELEKLKKWVTNNPHEDDDGLSIRGTKALLARLDAAEELIESAGDLKRSEAAQEWLKIKGNSLYGIPVKIDPSLPPGKWQITGRQA